MEGGQSGKKIGIIIQARYSSSRLPGKVLHPLPFGSDKPLLLNIVEKFKSSSLIDEIIIATSIDPSDDIIEDFCRKNNISFFRGSLNNVLKRFVDCANHFDLDIILRKTGDNPISFVAIIEELIAYHINNNNDYTNIKGLPIGTGIEVFNRETLLKASEYAESSSEQEHVTIFIKNSPNLFKVETKNITSSIDNVRLTVDYPSDYALINFIFQAIENKQLPNKYTLNDLEGFFQENPWLCSINNNQLQKKQLLTLEEELNEILKIASVLELNKALNYLRKNND